MPTETFLRLPEEKRTRFVEAAWKEFLRVPFEEASINKIVINAGVPRGSFYQYFADKKTVFFYLVHDMMHYLLAEYGKVLRENQGDIFCTQLQCFDLIARHDDMDPQFARGMELLRLNPVFLAQKIVEHRVACRIWEVVREQVDVTMFRNEDEELAKQTLIISMVMLVMTMTDAMTHPEETASCRQMLAMRMEVLQHGSLKPCGEGVAYE